MTADSEAVLAGFAAALYSTVSADELATVEDTERFLVAASPRHAQLSSISDRGEGPAHDQEWPDERWRAVVHAAADAQQDVTNARPFQDRSRARLAVPGWCDVTLCRDLVSVLGS